VCALKEAFGLQIGNVFMHSCKGAKAQTAGDLLVGRGIAILLGKAGEEVNNLSLPSCDSHADNCSE
jgi:hypothetical protein